MLLKVYMYSPSCFCALFQNEQGRPISVSVEERIASPNDAPDPVTGLPLHVGWKYYLIWVNHGAWKFAVPAANTTALEEVMHYLRDELRKFDVYDL